MLRKLKSKFSPISMHSSDAIVHSLLPSFLPLIFVPANVTQLPENIWWLITCRKDSERGYPADKSSDITPTGRLRSVPPSTPTRITDRSPDLANLHPIPTNVLMICYIKAYRRGYCRIVEHFTALMPRGFPLQTSKRRIRPDGSGTFSFSNENERNSN